MKHKNVSRTLEQWIKKLKCSGSSGIGLETFSDIRVGVDPAPVSDDALQFPDPVTSEEVTQCLGAVTNTLGEDMVTLELSDQLSLVTSLRRGLRHGRCELYSLCVYTFVTHMALGREQDWPCFRDGHSQAY